MLGVDETVGANYSKVFEWFSKKVADESVGMGVAGGVVLVDEISEVVSALE